ncbi:MAG TPA: DUF302 domain-containing protein [Pseudonocardia sp.]
MTGELTVTQSSFDVPTTVGRIEQALADRGVQLFASIDHAAGARAAGLVLPDEVLIVFGSPAVGTAVLQADARAGLDLPLRMLVWSADGQTSIAFRDQRRLAEDYDLAVADGVLAKLNGLLEQLAAEAAG